jgi:hypothetical protein
MHPPNAENRVRRPLERQPERARRPRPFAQALDEDFANTRSSGDNGDNGVQEHAVNVECKQLEINVR